VGSGVFPAVGEPPPPPPQATSVKTTTAAESLPIGIPSL
jgi:hypothetical protein